MRDKFQSQKGGLLLSFHQHCIQCCLILETQSARVPKTLQIYVLVLRRLYFLSFLVIYLYEEASIKSDLTILKVLYYSSYLSRYQLFMSWFYSVEKLLIYGYLPILGTIILILFYFIWTYWKFDQERKTRKAQNLGDFLNQRKFFMKLYSYCMAYYIQFLGAFLAFPSFEVVWSTFIHSLNQSAEASDVEHSIHLVLSLITTIVFIGIVYWRFTIGEESLNIVPYNFQRLIVSFSDLLALTLKLLFVLLNVSSRSLGANFYVNLGLLLLITVINLSLIIGGLSRLCNHHIQWELACSSFTITFIGSAIALKITELHLNEFAILMLLIFLLTYHLLQRYWIAQQSHALMCTDSLRSIQYFIGYFILNDHKNDGRIKLIEFYHFRKHRIVCNDNKCLCKLLRLTKQEINRLNIQVKCVEFHRALIKYRNSPDKFGYYIHYISLLQYLGLATQAFQQTNVLLYRSAVRYSLHNASQRSNPIIGTNQDRSSQVQPKSGSASLSSKMNNMKGDALQDLELLKAMNLGFLQRQKILIVQEQIKLLMNQNFMGNKGQQLSSEELSHSVHLFLQAELNNNSIIRKILKSLQRKVGFLQMISGQLQPNSQQVFELSKRLSKKLMVLEKRLYQLYDQFPSQKNQSLNSFYQAEIMNNYALAFKLTNITTIADEKLMKMHQNMQINLFSSTITYMIVGFKEGTYDLQLNSHSNGIHKFFGYEFEKFQQIDLMDLIPRGIKYFHEFWVMEFMTDGHSKYFRNITQNLVAMNSHLIKAVDFFFDINFTNQSELTFAVFFLDRPVNNGFLIINRKNYVSAVSAGFLQMVGIKPSLLQKQKITTPFVHFKVDLIIPEFCSLLETIQLQNANQMIADTNYNAEQHVFNNQTLCFLTEQAFIEMHQGPLLRSNRNRSHHSDQFKNPEKYNCFQTNLTITSRSAGGNTFYILEIDETKQTKEKRMLSVTTMKSKSGQNVEPQQVSDMLESAKEVPREDESLKDLFAESAFDILDEDVANQPNAFENNDISQISAKHMSEHQSEDMIAIKLKQVQVHQPSQIKVVFNQDPIFSPRDSFSGLILKHDESGKPFKAQQKYFIHEAIQESESLKVESSAKPKQPFNQFNLNALDEDQRNNIIMQMQQDKQQNDKVINIDDAASQISSLAGFRKSKFFKKYETLQRVLDSNKHPSQFSHMLLFMTLVIITFLVLISIVLAMVSSDLERFLVEIDMLHIKASFMGPADTFINAQQTYVNYYVETFFTRIMNVTEGKALVRYPTFAINDTYYVLRKSFENQLSNPYLEEFFTNQYINVSFLGDQIIGGNGANVKLVTQTISFRESLYFFMGFLHDFAVLVPWSSFSVLADISSPFFTYQYANYLAFNNRFSALGTEIYDYTVARTADVKARWTLTMIPFIVVQFLLVVLSFLFYRRYIKNYERLLDFYKFIDPDWLQKDIERYKIISDILVKDNSIILKYYFDLEQREKYLQAEDLKKENAKHKKIMKKEKKRSMDTDHDYTLPRKQSVLVFTLLFGLFVTFTFVVLTMTTTFLDAYVPTANFYKSLADVSVAVSGVYAKREISYYISIRLFAYYNDTDKLTFIERINENLDTINDFSLFIAEFNGETDKYLLNRNFIDQFQTVSTADVCDLLTEEYRKEANEVCQQSLGGVLQQGLNPTLVRIRQNIQGEILVNNLTTRITTPLREMEIAIVVTKALDVLIDSFKVGLVNRTQQLIDQIIAICIIFLLVNFIILVILYTVIKKHYEQEFQIVKRFLILMPQQTIFLDTSYERALRLLVLRENLL